MASSLNMSLLASSTSSPGTLESQDGAFSEASGQTCRLGLGGLSKSISHSLGVKSVLALLWTFPYRTWVPRDALSPRAGNQDLAPLQCESPSLNSRMMGSSSVPWASQQEMGTYTVTPCLPWVSSQRY